MDGANEWQVFRRITVPLLAPVLAVVLVTLMINVLKIFDLVYIIAPGSSQDDANVLALQLYLLVLRRGDEPGRRQRDRRAPAAAGAAGDARSTSAGCGRRDADERRPSTRTGRSGAGHRARRRRAGGRWPARIARWPAASMRVFLVLVGLFWLMPTVGLLLSSLRDPTDIAASGWWKVFTAPGAADLRATTGRLLDNRRDHRLAPRTRC